MSEIKMKDMKDHKEYKMIPYTVTRTVLELKELSKYAGYKRHKDTPSESLHDSIKDFSFRGFLYDMIPVMKWIPEYPIKKYLMADIMCGITVAVMNIPQGMAYGLLAGLDPIVGLYMAFFPALIYFVFGTSRHVSMGTFAVTSLMTAKVVSTYSHEDLGNGVVESGGFEGATRHYTPNEVATAVTFMVGIYLIMMSVLRLGTLSSLLSEPLVNGFTTAVAFHVMISQAKDLLGVSIPKHRGAFKILLSMRDLGMNVCNSNITAVYLSIACIAFMVFMNEIVKPWASKKSKIPLPSELLVVLAGTIVSYYMKFGSEHGVKLVGKIPTGLPVPQAPPMELLRVVAVDSIGITIVSYSIAMSMSLIFARKFQYEVRANQELLAMGFANIVGSFFTCIPIGCSLSRSLVQQQTGGKTQLASVVSGVLVLIVLLWLGPYFETLPRAVLASIIIVALKGMIMQIKDLKRFTKEGVLEMTVWLTTFLSTIIIDIDIGLFIGVFISLFTLYIKGWKSYYCMLALVPNTDLYVDVKTHKTAIEIPNTKIFRYCGSINFASRSGFKKALMSNIGLDVHLLRRSSTGEFLETKCLSNMKTLIIDLSAVPHLDISGCNTFTEVQNEMKSIGVKFLLASPNDCVYDALLHSSAIGEGTFQIYATIHDAVLYSTGKLEA